jgi:hypothetical protein
MQWPAEALLLGLTGCGLLLLRIGEYYFQHKWRAPKSVGVAATLVGVIFLIAALAMVWVDRIRHLRHLLR